MPTEKNQSQEKSVFDEAEQKKSKVKDAKDEKRARTIEPSPNKNASTGKDWRTMQSGAYSQMRAILK